ncbi:MAG: penicillin acylase family protein, partial [Planctomycetaceae bacterium]
MNRLDSCSFCLFVMCGIVWTTWAAADDSPGSRVELVRDRWGIANVYADTDESAMFGLGSAAAEDRAFQMYLNARTMQGRSAEVRGNVTSKRDGSTTVDRDRRHRILRVFQCAAAVVPNLDAETQAMLVSYSAGVNAFMQAHPNRVSPLFEKTGLIPEPWTPGHCVA